MIQTHFDAVLFDCDGVLVDSEPIVHRVLRDMLEEVGWTLTLEECSALFIGKAIVDEIATIENQLGRPLPSDWMMQTRERRNAALRRELTPIRNVHDAVRDIHAALGGRIACASGADRAKVEPQLTLVELFHYFEGRIFSGEEMPRSKPAPDVYLAAADALHVLPARCAVVEDTVTGVLAGVAAGAVVFGYSPPELGHDKPETLMNAGATIVFTDMAQLAMLLASAAHTT